MSSKYTSEVLQDAVSNSTSIAGVLRHLNLKQAGGTHTHISRKVKEFNIDTSHFKGQGSNLGKVFPKQRRSKENILVVLPDGSRREKRKLLLRSMLEEGLTYQCAICYTGDSWHGSDLTLEIDHIDGNWYNNLIDNLRFLCPNCHSQQKTTSMPHKSRSRPSGEPVDLGSASRDYPVASSTLVSCTCGKRKHRDSKQCRECSNKERIRPTKIEWPSLEELERMISETSYLAVGRQLGVSDNAVRKAVKRLKNE